MLIRPFRTIPINPLTKERVMNPEELKVLKLFCSKIMSAQQLGNVPNGSKLFPGIPKETTLSAVFSLVCGRMTEEERAFFEAVGISPDDAPLPVLVKGDEPSDRVIVDREADPDNILDQRVDELEVNYGRVGMAFRALKITYIGELVQHSEADFLKVGNFGRRSLKYLKDALSELKLALGTSPPENWTPPTR